MKKSRFSEEQIIGILKQAENGRPVAELVREHGITETTFYRWRRKFGGMEVSDARRLKELEEENRKLKRMVADQALDIVALKDVFTKSGEAAGQESGGSPCAGGARPQRTPRLWADRDREIQSSLRSPTEGRRGAARAAHRARSEVATCGIPRPVSASTPRRRRREVWLDHLRNTHGRLAVNDAAGR